MPTSYRGFPPVSAGIDVRRSVFPFLLRPLLFCIGLSLAVPIPLIAQVVPPAPTTLPAQLTLPQAIAIALQHQPQQYTAKAQITQAQGQKLQAQSQYYPTITPSYQFQNRSQALYGLNSGSGGTVVTVPTGPGGTGGIGGTGTGGTGTGTGGTGTGTGGTGTGTGGTGTGTGTSGTGTTGTVTTAATGTGTPTGTTTTTQSVNEVSVTRGGGLTVSLSQNLFDNGARETTNAQARRALEAANFNNANVRQDTILAVTQNYYQLLEALDIVKVARAQVARYTETLAATTAQVQAGTTAQKEILQAQADLANAQVTLLQNQNQVTTASAALKNTLGVNSNAVVQPAPLASGDQLPPLPDPGPDTTLEAALATAFASRPDLRQQQAIVASSSASLAQARRQAGFTVSSDYVLTYQATNDVGARGTTSQLLVSGSYPLFDAGSARGAVRIAQAQKDISQNQLEQIRQQIHQDVEQTYATRAVSVQAARLAQAAVTAAQSNYQAALGSQRAGVGTIIDVITAQATLQQAQNQFVNAVYNFYIADAQLSRSIGRNDASYAAAP